MPEARRVFRQNCVLQRSREECRALRWLLGRGDQSLAMALPDGEILATTLPTREVLQALRFGSRHYNLKRLFTLRARFST
jgi:hypothetical protein